MIDDRAVLAATATSASGGRNNERRQQGGILNHRQIPGSHPSDDRSVNEAVYGCCTAMRCGRPESRPV